MTDEETQALTDIIKNSPAFKARLNSIEKLVGPREIREVTNHLLRLWLNCLKDRLIEKHLGLTVYNPVLFGELVSVDELVKFYNSLTPENRGNANAIVKKDPTDMLGGDLEAIAALADTVKIPSLAAPGFAGRVGGLTRPASPFCVE